MNNKYWKWFMRVVNDIDIDMYNQLAVGNYKLSDKQKQLLLKTFDINGCFGGILNELIN